MDRHAADWKLLAILLSYHLRKWEQYFGSSQALQPIDNEQSSNVGTVVVLSAEEGEVSGGADGGVDEAHLQRME